MPATILAESEVTIEGLPDISDIQILKELLEDIGGTVSQTGEDVTIDSTDMIDMPLPEWKGEKTPCVLLLYGCYARSVQKSSHRLTGGCNLGPRPIDQHIKGFEALGAKVTNEQGAVYLRADELVGAKIYLDVVSVGATINIMLAAVRAKGKTIIENAAKEPEIIDVATLLNSMGANIKGVGTDVIRIEGTDELKGCKHTIIPDRIEAGTYTIMAAAKGGEVIIDNVSDTLGVVNSEAT